MQQICINMLLWLKKVSEVEYVILLISMPKLNKNALKILILSHHILSVEMPLKVM